MTAPAPPPLELMADQDGERLDVFLARRAASFADHAPGAASSRSQLRRLIDDGRIRVDGSLERAGHRLSFGQMVTVLSERAAPVDPARAGDGAQIELQTVFEDDQMAVIDKQPGLTVHPAPGEREATLVTALLQRWPQLEQLGVEQGDALRPGIVHRLDRDTSGLLMIAKTAAARDDLQRQLRERSVDKRYHAVVAGRPDPEAGLIDAPIGRDPADPRRMTILERGRPSRTGYQTLETFSDAALVECDLITGRTHQIRVHLAAVGLPIAGDDLYGVECGLIGRQALHARELAFDHPDDGRRIALTTEPPDDFARLLASLRDGALLMGEMPDGGGGRDTLPAPAQGKRGANPKRRRKGAKRRRSQRIR